MRNFAVLLLAGVILLAACGNNATIPAPTGDPDRSAAADSSADGASKPAAEADPKADASQEAIEVDKGLLSTTLTLPASLLEGADMSTLADEAKADGIDDVTINDDGSVTYKMSRAKHDEMMKETEASLSEYIDSLKNGTDFTSIKDVKHDRAFSEFTLVVDRAAYEKSFDGFAALGLYMSAALYQVLSGEASEDVKVTVHVQDETTNEVFGSNVYPDAMQQ